MARLFITPREIDLISDLSKEITKDVIGQVIYFYKTRVDLSQPHDVYDEMTERIFDNPVEIDCRVQWNSEETRQEKFGMDTSRRMEIYVHFRDMLDRSITISEGDFVQYGTDFFEITTVKDDNIIFGQIEYKTGVVLSVSSARKGLIDKIPYGPLGESYTDENATQKTFVQQQGKASDGDKRQLVKDGILGDRLGSPQTVRPQKGKSSFYGDES
jgi:hypothetical protein